MRVKAAAALIAAVVLASCSASGRPAASAEHRTYVYTCCAASDISRAWHPGQTFVLHWVVRRGPLSSSPSAAGITLTASLTGPYRTVASLKAAGLGRGPGTTTFAGKSITTTDWSYGHPVTRISVPATAAPGLYNLRFGLTSGGVRNGGATIVRVTPSG